MLCRDLAKRTETEPRWRLCKQEDCARKGSGKSQTVVEYYTNGRAAEHIRGFLRLLNISMHSGRCMIDSS